MKRRVELCSKTTGRPWFPDMIGVDLEDNVHTWHDQRSASYSQKAILKGNMTKKIKKDQNGYAPWFGRPFRGISRMVMYAMGYVVKGQQKKRQQSTMITLDRWSFGAHARMAWSFLDKDRTFSPSSNKPREPVKLPSAKNDTPNREHPNSDQRDTLPQPVSKHNHDITRQTAPRKSFNIFQKQFDQDQTTRQARTCWHLLTYLCCFASPAAYRPICVRSTHSCEDVGENASPQPRRHSGFRLASGCSTKIREMVATREVFGFSLRFSEWDVDRWQLSRASPCRKLGNNEEQKKLKKMPKDAFLKGPNNYLEDCFYLEVGFNPLQRCRGTKRNLLISAQTALKTRALLGFAIEITAFKKKYTKSYI